MTAVDDGRRVELEKRPNVLPFPRPPAEMSGRDTTPPASRERQLLVAVRRRGAHLVTTLRQDATWARAARVAARGVWVCGQGGISWAHRAYSGVTHGHYREQIRLARPAGDREGLRELLGELREARNDRVERLVALPRIVIGLLAAAGMGAGAVLAVLLAVGVVAFFSAGAAGWVGWWAGVGSAITTAVWVARWTLRIAVWAAVPVGVVLAWREGKRRANPPTWLLTTDERARIGSEITADSITAALAHMKIAALSKALKDGAVIEFLVSPRAQGGGTYFQARLPLGVAAAEMLTSPRVELFAGNLSRHRHEVWPQRQPEADARVLDCWIADKGTLDKPAPPWPLLDAGEFDVFRDRLPWGVTMRSEQVAVGMLQKHWLIGATSKQGKTSSVRLLFLGLALDLTVELRIADLKGDGDWSMFAERAHTLIEGQSDEDAEAAAAMLEDLVAEMGRRYELKRRLNHVGPITREMSRRKGSGFHPIYAVVDECQVMYAAPHPVGGVKDDARAWRAAKRLHDQARAVNIHLMQATQRPDNRTLPVLVREGAHVRAALNVPNEEAAKMVLADAAERGARPQDLRPGRDAGTVVVAGEVEDIPDGMAFAIVRTHYVSTEQAYAVVQRAVAARARSGRDDVPAEPVSEVDHLGNIREALAGEARVRTTTVLHRLTERDPDRYEEWSHQDLAGELRRWEVLVRKSDGRKVVHAEDVDAAIAARDARRPAPQALQGPVPVGPRVTR